MGELDLDQKGAAPSIPVTAKAGEQAGIASALTDEDTLLMLQVRNRDREAAGQLVRRNFDRVARYIGRVVRDPRLVEDLTQETFVQVFSHADRYEPKAKFSTWLYRIATNTALKCVLRPEHRRRVADSTSQLETVPALETEPDARLNLKELRNVVADALAMLPLNQRVALTLFEYEDLSYEQIAAVMGVTVESVRSLLMRARTTLRQRLSGLY